MSHDNPKSQLNMFCQRKVRKTIGKEDIIYTWQKFQTMHQATVTLACLGGVQFAGQLATTVKEAEQNAARVALDHYAEELAALPPNIQGKKRKLQDGEPPKPATTAPGTPGPVTSKSLLNMALGRLIKRPLRREDIQCTNLNVGVGFQCTLTMPGMAGTWGQQAWAGEVAATHKTAEESAAKYAMAALHADPTFAAILSQPKVPAVKKFFNKGGSKGGGKGSMGSRHRELQEQFVQQQQQAQQVQQVQQAQAINSALAAQALMAAAAPQLSMGGLPGISPAAALTGIAGFSNFATL